MASKDAHLYGSLKKGRTTAKEISGSSSVAFSSALSNLIKASASGPNKTAPSRSRSKKEDIFSSHNKNVKKRALKDLEDSSFTQQKHRGRTVEEKAEDDATWRRTKRRMEEKARLYHALKRGDIEDLDDKYGVDFDAKWAEKQGKEGGAEAPESESDSESEQSEEELIEYMDEFGRTRKGTRAEAAREKRKQLTQAADEPDRFTARPSMPASVIYGDTVQTQAFNPDETIAQQMAELAAKRDKELTPPPEVHFDGREEMRQRGTGYFQFSKDEEERRAQMSNLEQERQDTEKARAARNRKLEERKEFIRDKKKKIQKKRAQGQAARFLNELGDEMERKLQEGKEGGGDIEVKEEGV
ncbi:hypothetical protein K505DRAFT_321056 [Melanomma pulvis-pyrius CBS 109.77]|uniref:DUF4078 domain-containing protein n=1 Tax=Melanomma pulvis-pyrius CBS 109.77 TaxID=1314802 RepID=A0A6A6XTJ2_9PLEO|nr:hypothetical protein K505DRAFT_321056 [Melanomma pulvis-pyrius CBS 109.77]